MNALAKIAFLDRDGTLVLEPHDEQVDRLDKIRLVPNVIPALLRLRDAGWDLVMVTNQDGLGTDSFPHEDFTHTQAFIVALFESQGIRFREVFICPHRADQGCGCRKPSPGILGDFLTRVSIDRQCSFVVGDRDSDVELAQRLGLRGFRIDPLDPAAWPAIVAEVLDQPRRATVRRETRETRIEASVDLDATGPVEISTGQ